MAGRPIRHARRARPTVGPRSTRGGRPGRGRRRGARASTPSGCWPRLLGVARAAARLCTASSRARAARRRALRPGACAAGRAASRCSTSSAGRRSAALPLAAERSVLVPRPETELLVGWALALLPPRGDRAAGDRRRHRLGLHRVRARARASRRRVVGARRVAARRRGRARQRRRASVSPGASASSSADLFDGAAPGPRRPHRLATRRICRAS